MIIKASEYILDESLELIQVGGNREEYFTLNNNDSASTITVINVHFYPHSNCFFSFFRTC